MHSLSATQGTLRKDLALEALSRLGLGGSVQLLNSSHFGSFVAFLELSGDFISSRSEQCPRLQLFILLISSGTYLKRARTDLSIYLRTTLLEWDRQPTN